MYPPYWLSSKEGTYHFPDGFFFEDYADDWPNTGKASVVYSIDGGVTFYLFDDKDNCEIREKYTIEQCRRELQIFLEIDYYAIF